MHAGLGRLLGCLLGVASTKSIISQNECITEVCVTSCVYTSLSGHCHSLAVTACLNQSRLVTVSLLQ